MTSRHTYPQKPGEQAPVCPHCNGSILVKAGHDGERQRYQCRGCGRRSYGIQPAPEPYLRCAACNGKLWQKRKPDGRTKFTCSRCGKCRMSEYRSAPREASKIKRYRHKFAVVLDRHAQAGLVEHVQSMRCTDAQAVRAIFRHVLTGRVFSVASAGRPGTAVPIPRNPIAARARFPSLTRESARKKLTGAGGCRGNGFQPTILGVQTITVLLDDEAKEGLIYAMARLDRNHADAARWLLSNVRLPGAELKVPLRPALGLAFVAVTGGKRLHTRLHERPDPAWNDGNT